MLDRTAARATGTCPSLIMLLLVAAASRTSAQAFTSVSAFSNGGGTFTSSSSSSSTVATTAAPGPSGCQVISTASSSSCANGRCCAISQKVSSCPFGPSAVATINNVDSFCCIVLVKLSTKALVQFCARPPAPNAPYMPLPPGTGIRLVPDCGAGAGGGGASTACTVTLAKLPPGYGYPAAYTASKPLVLYAGKGPFTQSSPCGNRGYSKFLQAVSRPGPPVALTSKCSSS